MNKRRDLEELVRERERLKEGARVAIAAARAGRRQTPEQVEARLDARLRELGVDPSTVKP